MPTKTLTFKSTVPNTILIDSILYSHTFLTGPDAVQLAYILELEKTKTSSVDFTVISPYEVRIVGKYILGADIPVVHALFAEIIKKKRLMLTQLQME